MIGIVKVDLDRALTFSVMAIPIAEDVILAAFVTPVDIHTATAQATSTLPILQ